MNMQNSSRLWLLQSKLFLGKKYGAIVQGNCLNILYKTSVLYIRTGGVCGLVTQILREKRFWVWSVCIKIIFVALLSSWKVSIIYTYVGNSSKLSEKHETCFSGRRQEDSVLSKLLGNKPAFQWVLGRRDGTVPSGVVKYPDQIGNVYVCISKGQNNVWNVMPFFNGGPVTSGPVFKVL